MKIREECTCGALIEVEDDDRESVRADVRQWRDEHRCTGHDPWAESKHSTTAAQIEFGFQPGEDQVMVRG